jgi:hypothetical protein
VVKVRSRSLTRVPREGVFPPSFFSVALGASVSPRDWLPPISAPYPTLWAFIAALLIIRFFLIKSLPSELLGIIAKASGLAQESDKAVEAPAKLAALSRLASTLADAASIARNRARFYDQGRAYNAWGELQAIQLSFERQVLGLLQAAMLDATRADSPELHALSVGYARDAQLLLEVARDAMQSLATRIAHYELLWSVWVAIFALAISILK